ncbi:probable cytochrome P450 313a4 [Musca autumnalis]|uniref:probable cytochrome P450 313a4 n=1 Tax=Musca autumnalis TaxID=221902 RepID=UPI003CFAAA31
MKAALGQGLLSMQGKEWQQHRKIMDTGFKFSKQVKFLPIFQKKMKSLFANMDKCTTMDNSYDILVYCREFTINNTTETLGGRDLEKSTTIDVKHYSQQIARIMEYVSAISYKVFYQNKHILKWAHSTIFKEQRKTIEFLHKELVETFEYYAQGDGCDPHYVKNVECVAESVLEAIKRGDISHELATTGLIHLFGGAFETTSSTLYFTILMLGIYPEYQAKVYEEVCEIFPDNDDGEFEVTYEHITQFKYLDMFIKETMRLFPTIPHFGRLIVGGDLTLSNGTVLPEGLEITVNTYNLHRNKDVWGRAANTFDPDNFLPSKTAERHPYAFIPFSKGIRSCIGMRYAEMNLKVAISKIVKRYKFYCPAKIDDFVLYNHISTQLASYPPLTVERRTFCK